MLSTRILASLIIGFALTLPVGAQLVTYDFEGETAAPASVAGGVSAGNFMRNPGNAVSFSAGNSSSDSISGSGWQGADSSNDEYWEFSVVANAGVTLDITHLDFDYRSTSSGPIGWELFVNDSSVASGALLNNSAFNSIQIPIPLSGVTETTVRISSFGASSSGGTLSIDNVSLTGLVTPVPEPTTWLLMAGGVALFALHRRKQK